MEIDPLALVGILLTAGGMFVGFVVWLVRQEGRINVLQTRQDATDKRVDGLEEQILERLQRIEGMLLQGAGHR